MEKLRIYQNSISLVSEIYRLIKNNPQLAKDYSLCDQVRRSSISIAANIAEGYMRPKKQFKNFLRIASGSANETVALLQVIENVYNVDTSDFRDSFKVLGKQINAFSKKLI